VLTKQHLQEILIFCFNWKKSAKKIRRQRIRGITRRRSESQMQEEFTESLGITQQAVSV